MPRSTATIAAEQRDAIYQLIRDHLSGVGDLGLALEIGDLAAAERLGREFEHDLRLLVDLGWAERDERRAVALTMSPLKLAEVMRRLRSEAAAGMAGSSEAREAARQDERIAARYRRALEACDELIAGIDPGEGDAG